MIESNNSPPKLLKRIPVYLNSNVKDNLVLFQFPEKHSSANLNITGLRYKPLYKQAEVDVALDTDCLFYDKDKAVQFTKQAPKDDDNPQLGACDDDADLIDTQVYSSSVLSKHANYMLCVLRNGALHLTPLSYAIQMRAHLKYLDATEPNPSATQEATVAAVTSSSTSPGGVEPTSSNASTNKMVQVKVRSKAEVGKDEMMRSEHELVEQLVEKNEWQTFFVEKQPLDSFDVLFPSISSPEVRSTYLSHQSQESYHASLLPEKTAQDLITVSERLHGDLPLYQIVQLPVYMRVPSFMVNCHVANTREITEYLQLSALSAGQFLQVMREFAVPIRDRWVVKSKYLYDGRPALARDFLLALFGAHEYVQREYFTRDISLPYEQLKNMIEEIAQVVPFPHSKSTTALFGWQLKGSPDVSFRSSLSFEDARLLQQLETELVLSKDASKKLYDNYGISSTSSSRRQSVSKRSSISN